MAHFRQQSNILFYFIPFDFAPSFSLAHIHLSVSLMPSCSLVKALLSMKIKMKHYGNATEINQLASTFVVACKREKVAGKLSKKVCGKWAFPGRNKNIRKSEQAQRIRHWSITRPTLIASLASRSCSCLYSCSSSFCCFLFYANLNITVRQECSPFSICLHIERKFRKKSIDFLHSATLENIVKFDQKSRNVSKSNRVSYGQAVKVNTY